MNLGGTFSLGRVRGIEIRVHWSWLLVAAFLSWSLASTLFRDAHPTWNTTQLWTAAIAVSAGFFASILLHELAHSVVAQAHGLEVPSITLFVFGGVSGLAEEPRRPGEEFRIAIVGPLTSWVLALLFGAGWVAFDGTGVGTGLGYLAITNFALGVFNLLPGFPLDGGRVLRALVWRATGDLERSSQAASRAGNVIAFILIAIGLLNTFVYGMGGGLWYVLIGLFLNNAASASYQEVRLERTLAGVRVRNVMEEAPEPVPPSLTLQQLVDERMLVTGERAFLVGTGREASAGGLITATDVAAVPRERWAGTTVQEAMTPAAEVTTVGPDESVLDAFRTLTARNIHEMPVLEAGRLVGWVTAMDLLQHIDLRLQLATRGGRTRVHASAR
jgi:Zn-dependent protease/CBS domain-containing protein